MSFQSTEHGCIILNLFCHQESKTFKMCIHINTGVLPFEIFYDISKGLISVVVAIYLGVTLSVEEVRKINGFVPCVINGVFEILKVSHYNIIR